MSDEWMPEVRMPMTQEAFERLPRNPAYAYQFADGIVLMRPAPRTFRAALDLEHRFDPADLASESDYAVESIGFEDHNSLAPLFAAAFERTQPFAGLNPHERLDAAAVCLKRTLIGEDGFWASEASFLARHRSDGVVSALLITLLPQCDGEQSYHWETLVPSDLWRKGQGIPHLTWVFSHPRHKGHGVGTRLLDAAVKRLRDQGYRKLLTTFIAGNDSSQLWHWRNGFTLLPRSVNRGTPFTA